MKKTVKNFISILLVAAMLLTLLPGDFPVLAEDTAEPAATEAPAEEPASDPGEGNAAAAEPSGKTEAPAAEPSGKTEAPAAEPSGETDGTQAGEGSAEAPAAEPGEEPAEPEAQAADQDTPAAESEEPATDPDEPSAEPDEPSAEPDEPSAEPNEPSTEPDEPTAEPGELSGGAEEGTEEAEGSEAGQEAGAAAPEEEAETAIAFLKSTTLSGVRITVSAEPGVFPEGSVLSVKSVPVYAQRLVDAAVESNRDEDKTVAVSYTFDIKVLSAEGEELQPPEGKRVSVSFALAAVADPNLDTQVYHVTDHDGALRAQELPVRETGSVATAQTDGFSYYTVEFTYDAMTYVVPGGSSVPLADILSAVGLSGEVSAVTCSDESLFSAAQADGVWIVALHRSFTSTEWMDVEIGGVSYRITVTDDVHSGVWIDMTEWSFDDTTGELSFTNCNEVTCSAAAPGDYPWDPYRSQIKSVSYDAWFELNDSAAYMFYGCSSLTSIDMYSMDTSNVTDMSHMFEGCSSLTSLDLTTFSTPSATTLNSMFRGCSGLTGIGLENFDTSNVTDFGNMFAGCSALTSLELTPLDMRAAANVAGMLSGLTGLTSIEFDTFTRIDATAGLDDPGYTWSVDFTVGSTYAAADLMDALAADPTGMANRYFRSVIVSFAPGAGSGTMANEIMDIADADYYPLPVCTFTAPANQVFYRWKLNDTLYPEGTAVTLTDDNVTITAVWIGNYNGLNWLITDEGELQIGAQNGSDIQSISHATQPAASAYPWNATENVARVNSIRFVGPVVGTDSCGNMFSGQANAVSADCRKFNVDGVTDLGGFFNGCAALTSVNTTGWDTAGVASFAGFFQGCSSLTSVDVTNWVTDGCSNIWGFFMHCSSLASVDVSSWVTSNVEDMTYAFYDCGVSTLDLSGWSTAGADSMASMFGFCSNLTTVTFGTGWSNLNVTSMKNMFRNCPKLSTLDLSSFKTPAVTDMQGMFQECGKDATSLVLDLHGFDTHGVTTMQEMFRDCGATEINVSGWNLTALDNMDWMFYNADKVTELDVSGWTNTLDISSMRSAFSDMDKLKILNIKNLSGAGTADRSNMLYNLSALQELSFNQESGFTVSTGFNTPGYWSSDMLYAYEAADLISAFGSDPAGMGGIYDLVYKVTLSPGTGTGTPETVYSPVIAGGFEAPAVPAGFAGPAGFPNFDKWEYSSTKYSVGEAIPITATPITAEVPVTALWYLGGNCDGVDWLITEDGQLQIGAQDGTTTQTFASSPDWRTADDYGWLEYKDQIKSAVFVSPVVGKGAHSYMFSGCSNMVTADMTKFNTADVTDLSLMFYGCSSLTGLDLSGWNTANVKNMYGTFYNCSSLASLNTTGWNTANVTDMAYLFYNCAALTGLDLSGWNTANVTSMFRMFQKCGNLVSLDLSGFNTGNVTNMSYMFGECLKLATLTQPAAGFNTAKVTNMSGMFFECDDLAALDVSNWDVSKVTNMSFMFAECYAPVLDVSNWNVSNVTNMEYMFRNCRKITTLDLSNWNTDKVTNMHAMFDECIALTGITFGPEWTTAHISNMNNMFFSCLALTSIDVTGWDTSNVTNMDGVFDQCLALEAITGVGGWDTSNVTTMHWMFYRCPKLTELDLHEWDTSNVTNMNSMISVYYDTTSSLTSVNVSGWDTSSVTDMSDMFLRCAALTELDISSFDMSATTVAGRNGMLSSMTGLKSLTLGEDNILYFTGFNTPGNWSQDLDDAYAAADLITAFDGNPGEMKGTYKLVYTATFDSNGGSGTMDPIHVFRDAPAVILPDNGFTAPAGFLFQAWDKGDPGEGIILTADTTIKAQWHQVWNEPTWTWAADVSSAQATFTCQNDPTEIYTQTLDAAVTVTTPVPVTCEADGTTRGTGTVNFNGTDYTDTKDLTVPALGHDWAAPSYTWAANNSSVTASRVCNNDPSHVETETVATASVVAKAATCTETGLGSFTATFTNAAFAAQSKVGAEIPALGHDWGTPTYYWSPDNRTVTAQRICRNDANHRENEVSFSTMQPIDPTCTETAKERFTAFFTNEAFATQYKTVESGPALGHQMVHHAAVEATCTEDGMIEYWECTRCEKFFADAAGAREITDLDSVIVPALGHSFKTAWDSDETGHWHSCERCGEKEEVFEHDPDGYATVEAPSSCLACGYEIDPKLLIQSHAYFGSTGDLGINTVTFTKTKILDDDWIVIIPDQVPKREGYYFEGWLSSADIQTHLPGTVLPFTYAQCKSVIVRGLWTEIIGEGEHSLGGGVRYRFDEGSYTVSGDPCVYGGDQSFYPSFGANLVFTEVE